MTLSKDIFSKSSSKILDFLIKNDKFDYTIVEIAKGAGISYNTVKAHMPNLVSKDIVKITRRDNPTTRYKLRA